MNKRILISLILIYFLQFLIYLKIAHGQEANIKIQTEQNVLNLPDQIHSDFKNPATFKEIFFSSISFGYNRTHDNLRFYPEYGQGSFYMSGSLLYDPAVNSLHNKIQLNQADYLSCDFYFAYDSRMRENFFNIDVLLYGKNKYESDGNSSKRSLYGFFNGFEYFRPGWSDSDVTWNRQIYKKKPHIQYTIWRAIQWTIINSYFLDNEILETRFSAGLGPSINSSLTATGILEGEEGELSHIFKSIEYRKQNYYYSVSFPVSIEFIADKIKDFRFGAGYNFYFFYPIENEKAFDILNILKCSIGYYLIHNCLLNVRYEYWEIESMVRDIKKDHWWNRMIMEIKFLF